MLILDTHVLIWLSEDNPRLREPVRDEIQQAWDESAVAISAISFWEVSMLAARQRIELPAAVPAWRADWLGGGLREVPVDGLTAIEAAELEGPHRDPADRLIVATTRLHDAKLVTADRALVDWKPCKLLRIK